MQCIVSLDIHIIPHQLTKKIRKLKAEKSYLVTYNLRTRFQQKQLNRVYLTMRSTVEDPRLHNSKSKLEKNKKTIMN